MLLRNIYPPPLPDTNFIRRTIFFLDATLSDLVTLTSSLPANAEIHLIDPTHDGLEQIALTLEGRTDIDALHIYSHGSAGSLLFGSTTLSLSNINSYASTLSQIGTSLSAAGDILLYSCNVGAGADGQAFVESVARLTQADVAASDDLTGSAALGGDWVLEVQSGTIEAVGAGADAYDGVLANKAPVLLQPQTLTFGAKVDYAYGYRTSAVTTDDINGDGYSDIITTDYQAYRNDCVVWQNNGDGTFVNKLIYGTGGDSTPVSVISRDMNGDGKNDLVTLNQGSQTVSVFIKKSDGTFTQQVTYPTGTTPVSFTIADFNDDGYNDLVTANQNSNTISMLRNKGDGTFELKVDIPTGDQPVSVINADVNGDGKQDLVVTNYNTTTFSVLINNGDGTFAPRVNYVTGDAPRSVTSADFNGDGYADLAVTNYNSADISVLLNKGDGTYAPKVNYTVGNQPYLITHTDINGDGYIDLAVANYNSNNISILLNKGDGTFAPKVDYVTGAGPASITFADFNDDGKADIAVANRNTNTFSVLFKTAQAAMTQFTEQTPVAICNDIVINDPEGSANWNGGSLKLQITANAETADTLALPTTNPGVDGIWLDTTGNKLMAGATHIGTADATSISNNAAWMFTFNENATNVLVQSVARSVLFNNSSDTPGTADRSITLTASDYLGASSSVVQLVRITPLNELPTLTAFSAQVAVTSEDTAIVITMAELMAKGNEADQDGTVAEFVIKSVSSGALKIGVDAATATPWSATNLTLDATHRAYWTPDANANGTLKAFTATVRDNEGAESTTAIQATVTVTPVNDAPILLQPQMLTFGTKVDYAAWNNTYAVTNDDINGDGYSDIVATNYDANSGRSYISVWQNNGDGTFTHKLTYNTGSTPASVIIRDMNGDGNNDLVTANQDSNTVSVFIKKSDGTFAQQVTYSTGTTPVSFTIADFNGDGYNDLVTANQNSNTISMLRNKGDGTFELKVDIPTGDQPVSVINADVNGDGKQDLVVTNYNTHIVSILINNGDGTFAPRVNYVTGDAPRSVTSADFNGDGYADLAVTNYNSADISVLLNKGDGTYAPKVNYTVGNQPYLITHTDINGDGYIDLAVANYNSNNISILLNKGDGTFAPKVDYVTGAGPASITFADFNDDGKADIAVANRNTNTFSVLFKTAQAAMTQFTEQTPVAICNDIVINDPEGNANWNGGSLKLQITANAETADTLALPTTNPSGTGIWLDTNGNKLMAGATHIGTANATSISNNAAWTFTFNENATNNLVQSVARSVLFNNSSDTPGTAERSITLTASDYLGASSSVVQLVHITPLNDIPILTAFSAPVDVTSEDTAVIITMGDLTAKGNEADQDGTAAEFVIKSVSSGALKIGVDAATATPWSATNLTLDATHHAYWTPDANANGILNAFTATVRDNEGAESTTTIQATVTVTPVNDAPVLLQPQTLTFGAKVDYAAWNNTYAVTNDDINGDGYSDVVATNYDANYGRYYISVWQNNGDGTFTHKLTYNTGSTPASVIIRDMNGDGNNDLVTANQDSNTVSVFIKKSDGTFAQQVTYSTGTTPVSFTIADFNGDGYNDLVTANQNSNTISMLRNKGDGTFELKVDIPTGDQPVSVINTDVNGDGKQDLVVTNYNTTTFSVLINNGDGTFAPRVNYATGDAPRSVTSADFNGDGYADLAVTNYNSANISVLLNNGDGTYASRVNYTAGSQPYLITHTDINGDGYTDLAVANYNNATISLLLNKGDGTFAQKVDYATGVGPQSITFGDFNRDGKADIAVGNRNTNTFSVLLNTSQPVDLPSFARKVAVPVASDIVISDPDGNSGWNGGTLKAQITANAEATDYLTLTTANPGGNSIWLDTNGNKLMAGTTHIGDANAARVSNNMAWILTFNNNATNNLVQSVARAISIINSPDAQNVTAETINRSITLTATDRGGNSAFAVLHHSDNVVGNEFGVNPADVTAPLLDSFVQAETIKGISPGSNLELIFNEAIQRGSGLIEIHSGSETGALVASYNAATSTNLSITGNTLTINPDADFDNSTLYFVTFDAGSLKDHAGNSYAGTDICHVKTQALNAEYHNLTGNITFWKTGTAIPEVTTTLASHSAQQLIELRNIQNNADGSRTVDIWVTSSSTTVNSLQLEFVLPSGSKASWQSGTELPSEWSLLANTELSGQFILGGMSTTALPSGPIKLGTLALTATNTPQYDELLLSKGFVGNDTISVFSIWPESLTSGLDSHYQHLSTLAGTYTLAGAKTAGQAESQAINANDALAALKMAVGLNPNADGSAVLPYQFLAADVNHDGIIRSTDAFNILKMAVKLSSAPKGEWLFVSESADSAPMGRNSVDWSHVIPTVTLDHDVELDLIGIVKGDVDGSWVA